MTLSAFPYPGGKTPYWNRIIQHFPEHQTYAEPFGGGAAVLLNKPESYNEVYNDIDDDVVHFFQTVREQREELEEWLRQVPYSEELHDRWATEFFNGLRPVDDVERAGRWFYLRFTQWGAKLNRKSGFKRPGTDPEARSFRSGIDRIEEVVDRFQEVAITKEDYREVIERYDGPETLFYCDPPYVDVGDEYYRHEGAFDHKALEQTLRDAEGCWVVSYGELPEPFAVDEYVHRDFTAHYHIDVEEGEKVKEATERLVMNFDPDDEPAFTEAGQRTLEEVEP